MTATLGKPRRCKLTFADGIYVALVLVILLGMAGLLLRDHDAAVRGQERDADALARQLLQVIVMRHMAHARRVDIPAWWADIHVLCPLPHADRMVCFQAWIGVLEQADMRDTAPAPVDTHE